MLDELPRLNALPAPGILFGRGLRLLQEGESGRQAIFLGPVGAKEVFVVSLTHLRMAPDHPLFRPILAYQLERVRRIAAAEHAP